MKWPTLRRPPPAKPGEVNYGFFDRFTFVHFGIGFAYAALGVPLGWTAGLAVAWEAVENVLKAHFPFLFPHASADTWQNSVGDTAAVLSGWAAFGLAFAA